MTTMEDGIPEHKPTGTWKLVMVLLPTLLLISATGAVWFHWYRGEDKAIDPKLAQKSSELSLEELEGHLNKLTNYIGERSWETEVGRKGLRRTIAYLEGSLSPQNYGFRVSRENAFSWNGELWPTIWIEHAVEDEEDWIELHAAYDREPEELAIVLSVINELRDAVPEKGIRFVFSAQSAPEDLRSLGLEEFPTESLIGKLTLDGLERGDFSLYRKEDKALWSDAVVQGKFDLEFVGSGAVMDERGLLMRARWLRDFLRKAANGQ